MIVSQIYVQWPSLKDRRTVARLTLLYKIVKKLLVVPNHCLPLQTPVLYTRTQDPLKLFQLQSKLDVCKFSFLYRTIIQWNSLQIQDIDQIDLETFKNTVTNIFCKCIYH